MSNENDSMCSFHTIGMNNISDTSSISYENNLNLTQTTLRPNECIRIPSNQIANTIRNRSYDEIKAEHPIKFEIDHLRYNPKELIIDNNQRGISPGQCSTESTSSTSSSPFRLLPQKQNRPILNAVKCLKCELCPFMSITQDGITSHMQNIHNSKQSNEFNATHLYRKKIRCPGCDNIFYTKKSLKIHLAKDHQMSATEIMPLIESLPETINRKQKIYLRNVEVLKNPQFATNMIQSQCNQNNIIRLNEEVNIPHTNSAFGQIDNTSMTMCETTNDIQSNIVNIDERISISNSTTPSIDDLTNIRPDSGSSVQFIDSTNASNEWHIDVNGTFESYTQAITATTTATTATSVAQTTNWEYSTPRQIETYPITSFNPCQNEKKKIFIKNIDILKEPLILTPSTTSSSGRKQIHLRTVDEVNLMLSNRAQNEVNNPIPTTLPMVTRSDDIITLDDYVLNEGLPYNSEIIPQYLDNDVIDLVSNLTSNENFTNEYTHYTNSAVISSNIELPQMTFNDNSFNNISNNLIEDVNHEIFSRNTLNYDQLPTLINERSTEHNCINLINSTDCHENNYNISVEKNVGNCDSNYVVLTSQEIMHSTDDILDLTNDEVDQIIDNNLPSQCFVEPFIMHRTDEMDALKGESIKKSIEDTVEVLQNDFKETGTPEEIAAAIAVATKTLEMKKRCGRPKGARRTNNSMSKTENVQFKCTVGDCGMRFGSESVLSMHEQCHASKSNGIPDIHCPKCECDSEQIRIWNWNTLHTHLWREHNIDMELYSCLYCNFKTPILSRLRNTHMKIHSDARDFKCDVCEKAFKNSKQLKNHRRIHTKQTSISRCTECGHSFLSAKHLKEHLLTHVAATAAKDSTAIDPLKCHICGDTFLSKHLLRTHHMTHFDGKKFNCNDCDYKSNDHNAYRRHQMVHSKQAKYKCPHCVFQCIQSTNYKNHIFKKHPESAKDLLYICDKCNFMTVSKKLYEMHCLNHNR